VAAAPRDLPFAASPKGVLARVRLTPKGGADRVEGVTLDAGGRAYLKARVAAPPEGGKANTALVKLLARTWGLPPSRLAVVAGAKDRVKTILVAGDTADLLATLTEWTRSHHA
jgi:uncharacterized protein